MSATILPFPANSFSVKKQCEANGVPFIDLDADPTPEERVKLMAAMLGIPEAALDVSMIDDSDEKPIDPHDIGELAKILAELFEAGRYDQVKRAFECRSGLYCGALSLAIYTMLSPTQRANFKVILERMSRP